MKFFSNTYPLDLIQLHQNIWQDIIKETPDKDKVQRTADQLNDKGEEAGKTVTISLKQA